MSVMHDGEDQWILQSGLELSCFGFPMLTLANAWNEGMNEIQIPFGEEKTNRGLHRIR